MMRHTWLLTFLITIASSPAVDASNQTRNPFVVIRILHTNDIHGHLLPEPDLKAEVSHPPMFGGAASLATAIKHYRKEAVFGRPADVVLFVDAGDFFQGTPEGTLTRGESLIELFRMLRLDLQAAGNHDFDFGPETFRKLSRQANWPILALNIEGTAGNVGLSRDVMFRFQLDPFHDTDSQLHLKTVNAGTLRIAMLGWITDDMTSVTTSQSRRGLKFLGSLETARREVNAIRDTADLVIAVTHAGLHQDTYIANQIRGIDVIVGGHSHTALSPYYRSDSTGSIVVQAGGNLRDLGVLDLLYNRKTKKIVRSNSRLIPLYESEFPPDPTVRRWVRRLTKKIGKLLDEQVAVAAENYLKHADTESVPGNLLTDAMRWSTGAEVAFQNSYGIRADIPRGPITMRTLFTIMPFDNTVVSMTLTGKQILELLEQSAALKRGFLQVSGLRMIADFSRPAGERVISAKIADRIVDPKKNYRVATNSFLAEGGDLFTTFTHGTDRQDDGRNMRDVVKEYLRELVKSSSGLFKAHLENRIVVRGPAPIQAR